MPAGIKLMNAASMPLAHTMALMATALAGYAFVSTLL